MRFRSMPSLAAFHWLSGILSQRSRGLDPWGMRGPDWADPEIVEAISHPLPHGIGNDEPVITVTVRDGIPARALPRRWLATPAGPAIRIATVRGERLQAQSAPWVVRDREPSITGTATALVRDSRAPGRNYVITCGHVVAPDRETRFGDCARIGGSMAGYLAEWQPAIGDQVYRTAIDAALLEVTPEDAITLQRARNFLPTGTSSSLLRDLPIALRRNSGTLPGALKIYWSGFVDIPSVTPGFPDYFLSGAVGYSTDSLTDPGDSGAAIWDTADRLVGMHVGALSNLAVESANAVFSPIGPVLEWFAVEPYFRDDPVTLAVSRPASPPPVLPNEPETADYDRQVVVVACTLWGEARGEGEQGMRAVASVIANRLRRRWNGANTPAAVCLAHRQFSCWNADDPNRKLLDIPRTPDAAYQAATVIAKEVIAGILSDITYGATHYVASTLRRRPQWLEGKHPCVVIGRHEFYNDIS